VTHNHPEGIKGAKATAAAIYLARVGEQQEKTREETDASIKDYIQSKYGYDLSRTLDEIRPGYRFNETCQETVPEAIIAYLESDGFEDAIRNAVSLGGDADTLAAITGSIAEAEYGVWDGLFKVAIRYLDDNLLSVINEWLDRGLPTGVRLTNSMDWKNALERVGRGKMAVKEIHTPHKIKTNFHISEPQMLLLRRGINPQQMEDKWFAYFENGRICFHRSWTGVKIYEAEVQKSDSGYIIPEITVERDENIYRGADDAEDIQTFYYLVGVGLLGLELDFPGNDGSGADLLHGWSQFGRMML